MVQILPKVLSVSEVDSSPFCSGKRVDNFPAKAWRPDWTNWILTEPDIGYQAPFVYLIGALD